jgi:excisionase family DNA binding protein
MDSKSKSHVENKAQALILAEQLLQGKSHAEVLADQIMLQQETDTRISALETLYLNQKEILNFDEASVYLRMSKSTLYKLTSKKEIPHYKPNRYIYFERVELDRWIRAAAVKTEEQLNDQVNAYTMSKAMPV